jgi:hypothetical protein
MKDYIIDEIIEMDCDDDGYIVVKFKIDGDNSNGFREIETDEYFYWAEENFDKNYYEIESPVEEDWGDNIVYDDNLFNFSKWKDQYHEEETVINFIYYNYKNTKELPTLIYN